MTWAIVIIVIVAVVAVIVLMRRGSGAPAGPASVTIEGDRPGPRVGDFHVADGDARVYFDVPLPTGDVDRVLTDLLIREAVEVVREKRHTLPLGDVHRVVAFGRHDGEWRQVGIVELDTPGTLPPPMVPTLLPHAHAPGFDAFDKLSDLPDHAPTLADRPSGETLAPLGPQLRLPAEVDAGLRAQGVDPETADAAAIAVGVMRIAGYAVSERRPATYEASRAGQRVFVRTVEHEQTDHPELQQSDIDRFVVDFMSSGSDRGLLITEKFSPFEVYDRERREPRMRFVTRERLQAFVDALAVG